MCLEIFVLLILTVCLDFVMMSHHNKNIHFAVLMGITHRNADPSFYLFNRTLESVLQQTYQDYTLVLVGDVLSPSSEDIVFNHLKRAPKEKWIYQNIKLEKTERFIYKLRNPLTCNQNKELNVSRISRNQRVKKYW